MFTRWLLLLQVVLAIPLIGGQAVTCRDSNGRVEAYRICDGTNHCSDKSDENPQLCKVWKMKADPGRCSTGYMYRVNHGCVNFRDHCSYWSTEYEMECKLIKNGQIEFDEEPGMNLTSSVVGLLAGAVNATRGATKCPMLYTPLDGQCIAFFTLARVNWPEARLFCRSIYGDLLSLTSAKDFSRVIQFIQNNGLTSDFWLGGRYEMDVNAWAWAKDNSPMPLGSPYWATRHQSTCVRRPPPHTDPYTGPAPALPGAPCLNYVQAPTHRVEGWCSAITYEHYYYMIDDECQELRSPLCVLDDVPDDTANTGRTTNA